MGLFKMTNFCVSNNTIKKLKKLFNKRFSSRFNKFKFSEKKTNSPILKWGTYLNTHFSTKDTQMAKKHMRICSKLLATREMQINTPMR